ncbi:sulfatase-modifying factor protein [Nostoc sp. T09]|uniref:formylglycine-generating enzyme family protein n=1 Tax=Nostoc sp. T09 TaxID=1932621 RepID=UPI000A3D2572|nr:formylglycine-generating enzyme family protein [Nostoc sp. T09]OUL34966.1 sulfatase-modifying factor protein [Nostoc sp. T09]
MSTKKSYQLLQKAAFCYVEAGWLAEACRVWEQIGDYHQAALTYEQMSNWAKAAHCYQLTQNWSNAARCYLMCEQPQAAADCWQKVGETLKAAWIWADNLQQIYLTQSQLSNFIPQTETEALEIQLIIARCEASSGKKAESAKRLKEQLEPLLKQGQKHLYEWALTIAKVLTRPDLTAVIYATAYRGNMLNACQEWEQWAISTLGDATGIPKQEVVAELATYEFEVITVNRIGEIIERVWQQARYFSEPLRNNDLEMVYIPGGTFIMGSPEKEIYSDDSQRPQHHVTVQPFYMSKYQVTQAQWRVIANLPKIERDLNPDPSGYFYNQATYPVEYVSWDEAVEFCARLSKATKKEYRLPSEAEWEYACRAGTTTPFHYGQTITSNLANYAAASYTYAEEAAGEYRRRTTPVGSFPPNSFGLYDMHGNVYEWCADPWHDSYEGAPKDGRVWLENGNDNYTPVLRGGSWLNSSGNCRSGYRYKHSRRDLIYSHIGFRVCCMVGMT